MPPKMNGVGVHAGKMAATKFSFFLHLTQFSVEFLIRRLVEHSSVDRLHCWACSLVGLTTVDMSKMDLT